MYSFCFLFGIQGWIFLDRHYLAPQQLFLAFSMLPGRVFVCFFHLLLLRFPCRPFLSFTRKHKIWIRRKQIKGQFERKKRKKRRKKVTAKGKDEYRLFVLFVLYKKMDFDPNDFSSLPPEVLISVRCHSLLSHCLTRNPFKRFWYMSPRRTYVMWDYSASSGKKYQTMTWYQKKLELNMKVIHVCYSFPHSGMEVALPQRFSLHGSPYISGQNGQQYHSYHWYEEGCWWIGYRLVAGILCTDCWSVWRGDQRGKEA